MLQVSRNIRMLGNLFEIVILYVSLDCLFVIARSGFFSVNFYILANIFLTVFRRFAFRVFSITGKGHTEYQTGKQTTQEQ